MPTQILSTKLSIPPLRSRLVARSRLIQKLNQGLECGFVLVSAPAGYGKSTLLSAWLSHLGHPAVWYSLDAGDNDPVRFLTYLAAALRKIDLSVGQSLENSLQSSSLAEVEVLLTALVNDLTQVEHPFCLVLDDYHVIRNQVVHQVVTFLLENRPLAFHLVIAARADPSLPLSRLRAHAQMVELRLADLRFSSQEAEEFLNQVIGLNLSKADLALLETSTEGWIAGLQMAALSLQGRKDASSYIRSFGGENRYILDFLFDEVFQRQSEDIQDFLLQTSILERLCGSLCDRVTVRENSQVMLDTLERRNLFLISLDEQSKWYRYHHLFADLLRIRLHQTRPDLVQPLRLAASMWHEENGLLTDAIVHALAANDVERVASLVERNAFAIMERGELNALVQWLDAMPRETVLSRPWLSVSHAWALAYMGDLDAAEPLLQGAEKALCGVSAIEAVLRNRITGHIAAIRAYAVYIRGDLRRAAELASEALSLIPASDLRARGFATALLGAVLKWSGDLAAAGRASAEAVAISREAGDPNVVVHAVCDMATVQILRGQLHQAAATCRDALQIAGSYVGHGARPLPVTGHAYALLSAVQLEWNDLVAAYHNAREGIELCKLSGQADVLTTGYRSLSGALRATGDRDGSLGAIQEARRIANGVSSSYGERAAAWEARLRLSLGDVDAACGWARQSRLRTDDEPSFQYALEYCTLARVLLAKRTPEEALGLLRRLLAMAETTGAMGYAVEILALQAVAWHAQGREDQALTALERGLALAEPEGYVRMFADEGEPMGELLRQAAARGTAPDYASRLLAALGKAAPATSAPVQRTKEMQPSPLVEPLSGRELDVLKLLAQGCADKKIAETLVIARETVHKHLRNIYGKLDVHNRTAAVARARELGLL